MADELKQWYIIIPASPWGGRTGILGPATEADARAEFEHLQALHSPECPPKLARVVEDAAVVAGGGEADGGRQASA